MFALGVLVLLHLYIGVRIAPQLPGWIAPGVFGLVLLVSMLLIPAAFVGRRARRRAVADRWTWAGMLALGLSSMLLVATLLRDALLLVVWPLGWATDAAAPSAAAVPALALAAVLLGFAEARRTPRVHEVPLPIAGLPAALDGFTIVQITDLHVGPTVKAPFVRAVVEVVNRLDADVVAVTGDLVDGRVGDLAPDVAPLADLRARHGSYFVTGNHEYYSGAIEWTHALSSLGLHVLLNEHVVLQHGDARVVIAGVADWSAHHFVPKHRSDPRAAIAGAPADAGVRVLLAHQPRSAAAAADAGFDVQLSGHTHGGQIWPFRWLVPLQQPFTAGVHRLRSLWIYTSRGTGYWGPPLRLFVPSEITRLRLVAMPDAAAGSSPADAAD